MFEHNTERLNVGLSRVVPGLCTAFFFNFFILLPVYDQILDFAGLNSSQLLAFTAYTYSMDQEYTCVSGC